MIFIKDIEISSYKGFYKTERASFEPGINLIIGPNSAGKTALLDCLSTQFTNQPHRSTLSIPSESSDLSTVSSINITLEYDPKLIPFLLSSYLRPRSHALQDSQKLEVEVRRSYASLFPLPSDIEISEALDKFGAWVKLGRPSASYHLTYDGTRNNLSINSSTNIEDELYRFRRDHKNGGNIYSQARDWNGEAYSNEQNFYMEHSARVGKIIEDGLFSILKEQIYRFDLRTLKPDKSKPIGSSQLQPNGENLADVLDTLSKNPAKFNEFMEYVRIILPSIYWLSTPVESGQFKIKVWPQDPRRKREDLTIPLSDCGAGVAQVLSMLYVAFSKESRIILIDEPQSFLHPGASRALIEIFKKFSQHQYFIATHSPTVITSAQPARIIDVSISEDNQQSLLSETNESDIGEIQKLFGELGVSLADVFGAERVLWVEGPTEKACFPLLLKHVEGKPFKPLYKTKFLSVWQTSDFDKRKDEQLKRVIETYSKIVSGDAPETIVPPAVGFFIDRELRKDGDLDRLRRLAPGKVEFTNYRHFENYLLHNEAIAQLLTSADTSGITQLSREDVANWIEANKGSYLERNHKTSQNWIKVVDAAKLLATLFQELSNGRVAYQKTQHSVGLTQWLLENDPKHLKGLIDELKKFIVKGFKS